MFHGIALGVQLVGIMVVVFGGLRIGRAPSLAARRAATASTEAAGDTQRYARGLTDFYRISGAVAIVAGMVLLLVPVFAG